MGTFLQDVRYSLRTLGKTPGFTLVAIVTLALGIGANTAIFSVVNGFLFRPLPVRNPGELYVLGVTHESNNSPHGLSYPDLVDYRAQSDSFNGIAAYAVDFVGLSTSERAERITVSWVTGNYFQLLGLEPALGRLILPQEGEKPGADPILVLSHNYWKRRFGGDPGVVGRSVLVNGKPFTVVGVAPEKFHGTYFVVEMDAFLPMGMAPMSGDYKDLLTNRENHQLHTLGRLKHGLSRKQAEASLQVIARRLQQQYPETNKGVDMHLIPEYLARPEPQSGDAVPLIAGIFMALVGLVLLVACVNVANILLVRATIRQKEIAIRAALGAGRGRLIRQMLTESVLLSIFGGAAGLLLGLWASDLLASIRLPGDLAIRFDFSFDWRVFGYVSLVALFTGVVVGLVPALRSARADLNDALRESGRSMTGASGTHRMRNILVVAQVAGSLVLLIASGLFVRSLQQAQKMDLGFMPEGLLNVGMDPSQQGYDEARGKAFFRELEMRVKGLPGVESASFAYSVPLGYYSQGDYVIFEGQQLPPGEKGPLAGYNLVGEDYFQAMRLPLLRGRALNANDTETSPRVAVVNEFMAEHLWSGQDPIGKRFSFKGAKGPWVEVVGVVRNGKYQFIFEDPRSYFYAPLSQNYTSQRVLHVRTAGAPQNLASAVQQEIRALDRTLPVFDVITMEQALQGGNGLFLVRIAAVLAATLGGLGLILAVVGVYGVVSYSASQRTHEIGIRMALGAQRGDILRLVVSQGLALVLAGVVIGLAASYGVSRVLQNFLYGVSTKDPLTFAGVSLLLGVVALLACWIPARRATRVDPMVALRYE